MEKLKDFIKSPLFRQIFRFLVVGSLSFLIDFVLFAGLTMYVGLNYLLSATCSFIVAVLFNYMLSVAWVFNQNSKAHGWQRLSQMVIFIMLSGCGLLLNNFVLWCVVIIGGHPLFGKIIAAGVVMVFNFVSRKVLLEKRPKQRKS